MIDDVLRDCLKRFSDCLANYEDALNRGATKAEVNKLHTQLRSALNQLQKVLDQRSPGSSSE